MKLLAWVLVLASVGCHVMVQAFADSTPEHASIRRWLVAAAWVTSVAAMAVIAHLARRQQRGH